MLTDILIKNGLIVTMDRDRRVIRGSISIEGSEIREVGNIGEEHADEVIDAENKIIMPGLVCAHAHPCRILLRAAPLKIEPPSDFTQILQRVLWPADDNLTNEASEAGALATCLNFIKTGTTFFAGIHSSQGSIGKALDYIASAVERSGLRAFIGFAASERNTRAEGARGMKENIRFLENRQKERIGEIKVRGLVGLDSSFLISDELLRQGKREANRFDAPLVISTAEGKIDLYHNLEEYGKRTVERLRNVGFLSTNTVLAHCVNVNEDELSIIKKTGAKVAHSPMSDMLNAVGTAPVMGMKELDIPIGLGYDGYVFDGFENIRLLYLLHKFLAGDSRAISSMEALEMATITAADLYGMGNKIGSIEPGKRADLIIINPSNLPTPLRRDNVAEHIVNTVQGYDVETMVVGGDILMKNRSIKTLDEKRAMKKSRKTAEKLWENINP